MSIRAATSALKGRLRTVASHVSRRHQFSTNCYPDSIQSTTFDRDIIADKALYEQTGEPFVKEYRLLPNYFGSSNSTRKEEVSADDNDDKKPLFFMRAGASVTAYDANLSQKFDISPRFKNPHSSDDYVYCGSSNGLFCFQEERVNLIWNPATNEFKLLPEEDPTSPALIFSGFWFDPKSDDYKLMRLCFVHDFKLARVYYEIELYSFKTDSWKKIPCPDNIEHGWCRRRGVCINGVFYNEASTTGQVPVILCFDFSTETTCVLPVPPTIDKSTYRLRLIDYNGLLSVFVKKSETAVYQLWVMRDGSWDLVSLYHVCVGDEYLQPLAFSRNGELLFFDSLTTYQSRGYHVLVFDFATGKLKRLDGRASTNNTRSYIDFEIIPFSESFAKLKGGFRINNDLEEQENEEDHKLQQTNDLVFLLS